MACLPLHEAGLPLWSCILALCHHNYCLPGAVWSCLALVLSQNLVLFVHSMDLQPLAQVLSQDLVLFVRSMDLQPSALVLSQDLVLFVHSMDLQPFAQVLSQDLVQDDHGHLTLHSSQNGDHAEHLAN